MKQFKTDIVNAMIKKFEAQKIVSLKEAANELEYNHISAQDCRDIVNALEKIPDSKLIRLENTPNDSLFCSLCLADKNIAFDKNLSNENED